MTKTNLPPIYTTELIRDHQTIVLAIHNELDTIFDVTETLYADGKEISSATTNHATFRIAYETVKAMIRNRTESGWEE